MFKFLTFLLWMGVLGIFVSNSNAQSGPCALKLDVSRFGSENEVKNSKATIFNKKTNRTTKSTLKDGMPFFANLKNGTYTITLSKAGYKTTLDNFDLDCSDSEEGVYSYPIYLWSGKPGQFVKLGKPERGSVKTIQGDMNVDRPVVIGDPEKGKVPDISTPPIPPVPKVVSGGVVNGRAISLVKPPYPPAAKAVRASGAVNVQVLIDEEGNVISASAVSGHALLRAAAEKAARESKFSPVLLSGQKVKVTGVIIYNFTVPEP